MVPAQIGAAGVLGRNAGGARQWRSSRAGLTNKWRAGCQPMNNPRQQRPLVAGGVKRAAVTLADDAIDNIVYDFGR